MSKKPDVEYPCTQDNFFCTFYTKIKHRVLNGVCQSPPPNGALCKVCIANPRVRNDKLLKLYAQSDCVDSTGSDKNE